MQSTPATLLERLQLSDEQAWSRFVDLYTPLMLHWARLATQNADEAADLVQDVFAVLVRKLPDFDYDRSKTFRGWLRTVTLNKWRERMRRKRLPAAAADEAAVDQLAADDPLETFWEREYQQQLVARAMELVKPEFSDTVWSAFQAHVVNDQPPLEVAGSLGISIWTVYGAKSRVLKRLREELDGCLE